MDKIIKKNRVKIHFVDWDKLFEMDIDSNNGFIIDTGIDYAAQNDPNLLSHMDSIYSYRYGVGVSDAKDLKDMVYHCNCGRSSGPDANGSICDKCNTEVKYRKSNINIRGWLVLPKYQGVQLKIMNPLATSLVFKMFSGDEMLKLLDSRNENNLITLYANFESILSKKRNKYPEMVDLLIKNKEKIFSSRIPVVSKKLRLNVINTNFDIQKVITSEINNKYTNISTTVDKLKEGLFKTDRQVIELLKALYTNLDDIYRQQSVVISGSVSTPIEYSKSKKIKGGDSKHKMLRGKLYTFRLPYTARQMLTVAADIMWLDEAEFSIDVFRGIFKPIISEYVKNMPVKEKRRLLDLNTYLTADEKEIIRDIFNDLVEKGKNIVIINRQPTIYEPSSLSVKITKLLDTNVLRVHPSILGFVKGDIDGDVMSIFSLPEGVNVDIMSPREYFLNYTSEFSGIPELINDHMIHSFKLLDDDYCEEI